MRNLEKREQKIESMDLNPFPLLPSPVRYSRGYTPWENALGECQTLDGRRSIQLSSRTRRFSPTGYTLVELVIAVGVFALIMMLAAGAYIVMIGISRQTQGTATGVDNLSFAIETMTRTIRTGTNYSCNSGGGGGGGGGDCSGLSTFYVTASDGTAVAYALSNGVITQNGAALTDPSVTVTSLAFYAYGTGRPPSDYHAPRVTFIASGTVSSGPGKTEPFTVESGATMRGSDL